MLNADVGRRIVRHLSRHDIQSRGSLPAITASYGHLSLLSSPSLSLSALSLASIEISSRRAIVISKRPPWNSGVCEGSRTA